MDAIRLGPEERSHRRPVRAVAQRLLEAGQWRSEGADILIVADARYASVCRGAAPAWGCVADPAMVAE